MQDCSNSNASAKELLQSCTKSSIPWTHKRYICRAPLIQKFSLAWLPKFRIFQSRSYARKLSQNLFALLVILLVAGWWAMRYIEPCMPCLWGKVWGVRWEWASEWLNLTCFSPGLNGHHFTHNHFKCILINEKFCILIRISLKFVPKGPIDKKSALVHVMAWRWTGDKPLPKPMPTQFTDAYMRH